jgi:hypothetical protein
MCPLSGNKSELCNAALLSLMISASHCLDERYNRCALYAIESERSFDEKARTPGRRPKGPLGKPRAATFRPQP